MEYGVFRTAGCGQGNMEYGAFKAAGLLGEERRLWIKAGGTWRQVIRAHQRVAGSWQHITIRQKVGSEWVTIAS